MPRIPNITSDLATPEVREVLENQTRAFGAPLNSTMIYAYRPSILFGATALAKGIDDSALIETDLKNLVSLKAALINGCPF